MNILLYLIAGTGIVWFLAYQGAKTSVWIGAFFIGLLTFHAVVDIAWYIGVPLWAIACAFVLLVGVPSVRKQYLTRHLFIQFQKVMPPMSQTEKEALEAGSVWWDAQLFSGKPQWGELLSADKPELLVEERSFLENQTETLCNLLNDWKISHEDKDLSPEAWEYIRKEGFFGMIIPKKYGGLGYSAFAHSEVVMRLSTRSIAAAVTVMVPNSLGPGKLLLHYGTQKQKDYYLPRLAKGEEIPCFALTGPDAGSDAGAIPDHGIVSYGQWAGEKVLGIKLTWDKRYITLGPVATLIGLAFKLQDPDCLLGDTEDLGITVALVPADLPGIEIGERHITMDIPFQNGPNKGKDVFIPMSQLIGGEKYIGQGWRMLVESLAEGRGISLPALSVGAGKLCTRYTGAYAAIRQQFNMPIGKFEGVQEALARIAGLTYQMDASRRLTLSALDAGEKPSVISAILKYHLTEGYRTIINDAMDIQAGSAICMGPSNLISRAYQALPIAITVEGANILTRNMIIFGQGAMRCHPWVLKELAAAQQNDEQQGVDDFDDALLGHIKFIVSNIARSLFLGVTRGYVSESPVKGATSRYYQQLNWMSAGFALSVDIAMMTLGGALKRKERLSARLGDILSEMYMVSAVLKQFEDDNRPAEDLPLVDWACENSFYRIQEAMRSLFRNLPYRPLVFVIKQIIFPTGYPYTAPRDDLAQKAAEILLTPSAARDRLTRGIHVAQDETDRAWQYEQAFLQTAVTNNIEKTLRRGKRYGVIDGDTIAELAIAGVEAGLINESDRQELMKMDKLRANIIAVDSFSDYGKQHIKPKHQPDSVQFTTGEHQHG